MDKHNLSYGAIKRALDLERVKDLRDNRSNTARYFNEIYELKKSHTRVMTIHKILKDKGYKGSYQMMTRFIKNQEKRGAFNDSTIRRSDLLQLIYNRSIQDLRIVQEKKRGIVNYLNNPSNAFINALILSMTDFRIAMDSSSPILFHKWVKKHSQLESAKYLQKFIAQVTRESEYINNYFEHKISNGPVEGIVCKIKMQKRKMFGRCSFFTLRQMLLLQYST